MAIGEAGVALDHVQKQEVGNVTTQVHKMVEAIVLGMTQSPRPAVPIVVVSYLIQSIYSYFFPTILFVKHMF